MRAAIKDVLTSPVLRGGALLLGLAAIPFYLLAMAVASLS